MTPAVWNRLREISLCMTRLEWVRNGRNQPGHDKWGMLMGELDWLTELHELLYEDS